MSAVAPSRSFGLWLAAIAAILFSFKAILAKLLYRYHVDATTIIALRMLFAGPVFIAIALFETARAKKRGDQLSYQDCGLLILLGFLGYYLSSFLDFAGLKYISAALERLILFLTPTAVALLSMFTLKRRFTGRQWLAMAVSYLGVIFVFLENVVVRGEGVMHGSLLVFCAMLSYASYLVKSGEIIARIGSLRLVAYVMSASTLMTALHVLIVKAPSELLALPAAVYQLSIANAVLCTIIPVYLTMFAIARIGAPSASQMSMIGPVSLLFFGYWILGEPITLTQIIGTGLVLLGITLLLKHNAQTAPD
jgi:drug/metabolite transporter (DMT)-like permease